MPVKTEHIDRAAALLLDMMANAPLLAERLEAAQIFISLIEAANASDERFYNFTPKPDPPVSPIDG